MENWLTPSTVATVGFPIIICIWLMRSGQQTISDNTKSTEALTDAITKLVAAIGTQGSQLRNIAEEVNHVESKIDHLTELMVEHKTKLERNDRHEGH